MLQAKRCPHQRSECIRMISKVTIPNRPTISTAWLKGSGFIRSSRCMWRSFLMVAPETKLISEPLVFRPALLASFPSRSAVNQTLKTTSTVGSARHLQQPSMSVIQICHQLYCFEYDRDETKRFPSVDARSDSVCVCSRRTGAAYLT